MPVVAVDKVVAPQAAFHPLHTYLQLKADFPDETAMF